MGATTMAKPSVLCHAGVKMISAKDGRFLLNNGKQLVVALKMVLAEADVNVIADEEWCVDDLEETLKIGLHLDKVEYPDPTYRDGQAVCKN